MCGTNETDFWVCWNCGNENFDVQSCTNCYESHHAPSGTVKLVPIGKSHIKALVKSSIIPEHEGEYYLSIIQEKKTDINVPSTHDSLNISNAQQWDNIVYAVEEHLFSKLKWKSHYRKQLIQQAIASRLPIKKELENNPEFSLRLVSAIENYLANSEPAEKLDTIQVLEQLLARLTSTHADAFHSLILSMLSMDEDEVREIQPAFDTLILAKNQLGTAEMKRREIMLDSLEQALTIKDTKEIELHKLIASEPWMIDERYSLWFSNKTFKVILDRELKGTALEQFQDCRPDIGAVTTEGSMLIIELKRPSEKIGAKELHQLEDYLVVLRKYQTQSKIEGVLLGQEHDPTVYHRIDIKKGISFMTYTDLLQINRTRINVYLQSLSC